MSEKNADPNALTEEEQAVLDGVTVIKEDDDKPAPKPDAAAEGDGSDGDDRGEEGEEEEERSLSDQPDEERERIREARRAKRRRERERTRGDRQYITNLEQQVRDLNGRLVVQETRQGQADLGAVQDQKKRASNAYNNAMVVHAQAIKDADGEKAAQAMDAAFNARRAFENFDAIERQIVDGARRTVAAPKPLDEMARHYGMEWKKRNDWFDDREDPDRVQDAAVIDSIESRLVSEGYNPSTRDYWDELQTRQRKYLPHRATQTRNTNVDDTRKAAGTERARPNPPAAPRSGGRDSRNGNSVRPGLSRDQMAAIEEAAGGDDKRKAKLIGYAERHNAQAKDSR